MRARVTASGEFLSAGLPPGLYSATPDTLPAGVGRFLESVTLEGKDLFITPVRIDGQNVTGVVVTFTDRTTQLSGRIQDSAGKADPAASVVIFPADYRTWIQNGLLPQAARVVTASQVGMILGPGYQAWRVSRSGSRGSGTRELATGAHDRIAGATRHSRHARSRRYQTGRSEDGATMTGQILLFILFNALAVAQAVPPAQPQAPATASLSGTIVGDDAGATPIARAVVSLTGAALRPGLMVVADEKGHFAFANLPAGRFTLKASKAPYLTISFGQTTPGKGTGVPINVEASQQMTGLMLKVPRGSVISGRVLDARGQPVRGSPILIQQAHVIDGERKLTDVPGTTSSTDAQGFYRASGLAAGDYYICAFPNDGFRILISDLYRPGGPELHQVEPAELQWAMQQLRSAGAGAPVVTSAPPTGAAATAPPPSPAVAYGPVYFPGTSDPGAAGSRDRGPGRRTGRCRRDYAFSAHRSHRGACRRPGWTAGDERLDLDSHRQFQRWNDAGRRQVLLGDEPATRQGRHHRADQAIRVLGVDRGCGEWRGRVRARAHPAASGDGRRTRGI